MPGFHEKLMTKRLLFITNADVSWWRDEEIRIPRLLEHERINSDMARWRATEMSGPFKNDVLDLATHQTQ